jgi:hypothetical protein
MNTSIHTDTNASTTSAIVAVEVPDGKRLSFLPSHFGRLMMAVEQEVFSEMREICPSYTGGFWRYFTLSNGGCFMAAVLDEPVKIEVIGNGYEGTMSSEAAGITCTLFALSALCFRCTNSEVLAERFHQLRDFAMYHHEAGAIFAAID